MQWQRNGSVHHSICFVHLYIACLHAVKLLLMHREGIHASKCQHTATENDFSVSDCVALRCVEAVHAYLLQ